MSRFLTLILLLLCALPVCAETPSQVTNPKQARNSWVADEAHVLSNSNKAQLDRFITQFERQTSAEIAVVTVHNLSGQSVETWSNQLFNRWGIGKRGRNNGVLFVASIDEHKMRIEVGYGLNQTLTDSKAAEILDEQAKPAFRHNDFDGGVWDVVNAIATTIKTTKPQPKVAASTAGKARSFAHNPIAAPHSQNRQVHTYTPPVSSSPAPPTFSSPLPSNSFSWALLAIPGAGLLGLGVWYSTRPQKCETCDIEMNRMPEGAEDELLTEEQEFEQQLGSVDWAAWKCPKCAKSRIIPHQKLFSSYHQCPRCRNRTVRNATRVLSHATYDSTGTEEVTETCEWPKCRYTNVYQRTLARLTRPTPSSNSSSSGFDSSSSSSSSNSGNSFGGGSSGGGGASNSW